MTLDHTRVLNEFLLRMGGSSVDEALGNFADARVVDFLMAHGKEFSTDRLQRFTETPFSDWQRPLDPVSCHRNCGDLRAYAPNGRSEYRIVYGWALSDNGIWYCHSWCIRRTGPGNIIETTLARALYFGFVLPDEVHALSACFVPSTLGDELEGLRDPSPSVSVPKSH